MAEKQGFRVVCEVWNCIEKVFSIFMQMVVKKWKVKIVIPNVIGINGLGNDGRFYKGQSFL
ncbi:hypothetical protein [Membranihabitans marinus]|uniref:hypothetical protein n=1 Tax=Membranihabitans marinus TaxID=1227546 RepID=UPI001F1C1F66|nr:hypothetical protein [Membranihabitans marinus]